MRIGELARRSGASVRSLRHYEQQGLLDAARTSGNYRDYPDTSLDTVRVIRTLLQAGLTTATIGRLLPCIELIGGQATPCSDLLTELHHERRRLDQQRQALT
ncbi:MAG: MerR family transcriptional regulator [Geodermatophilaceae bacterium]